MTQRTDDLHSPLHPSRRRRFTFGGLESLLAEVRRTARSLLLRPGYAGIVTLTLALGIGGSCAIFALLHAAVLRPLPFPEDDRLAVVWGVAGPEKDIRGASPPEVADWRRMTPSLEGLTVYDDATVNLTIGDGVRKLDAELVSPGYLELLGAVPTIGRTLLPEDERPEGVGSAVIADSLWRSELGSDPEVVGRAIELDGRAFVVVGVAPPGFGGLTFETEVWTPLAAFLTPEDLQNRGGRWLAALGRIAPGHSRESVQAELDAAAARLSELYPESNSDRGAMLVPLREDYLGESRRAILVLFGGSLLLLVIACANVANLQIVRAEGRKVELAVREALGAGRGALLRHLGIESALLSAAGGLAGVGLAWGTLRAAAALVPEETFPGYVELRLSPAVVAFAVGAAAVTGVLVALAVGWARARSVANVANVTRGSNEGWRGGRPSLQRLIVGFEVATALVVVAGAGLAVRSLARQLEIEPGFASEGVAAARLDLTAMPDEPGRRHAFLATLAERVESLPGVTRVSVASDAPLRDLSRASILQREERPDERVRYYWHAVTPSFFATLGIPVVEGRGIGAEDHAEAPPVAVVSEAFARRFWPGGSPVGRRLRMMDDTVTIVGVAGNVQYRSLTSRLLDETEDPDLYLSLAQLTPSQVELVVRRDLADPLAGLEEPLREAVAGLDRSVAVFEVGSLERELEEEVAMARLLARLLTAFGALALLLSAVGLYGVTAFVVRGRRRELAIRGALGALPRDLWGHVVRQTFAVVLAGLAAGLAGALAAGELMSALLFEVRSQDPLVLGGALAVLAGTALAAAWGPAFEASRVPPQSVLRGE